MRKYTFMDCPICGSDRFIVNQTSDKEEAKITCKCGLRFVAKKQKEHYEWVTDNLYRRIEERDSMDVLADKWNNRTQKDAESPKWTKEQNDG